MAADGENNLVLQLTSRLEQLQREKDQLERAVEGQGDAIALKLRLALLAYEQQKPPSISRQQPQRSSTGSKSRTGSSSSSVSTSASTSSSVSFPSSPSSSSLVSPVLPAPDLTPDVLLALRENETLRVRLANSERVNAYYQRELAELRRRCGISIDELEELDLSPFPAAGPSGSGGSGSYPRQRSLSRPSRLDMYGGPSSSSIRIPGAATSVSPPGGVSSSGPNGTTGGAGGGRRSLASSFMFSPDGARSARFAASNSYTSSINTTATTPSSSYPNPRPPAATPATSAAFSPAFPNMNGNTAALGLGGGAVAGLGLGSSFSSNGFAAVAAGSSAGHQGFAERRNSLNGLVAAHFAGSSSLQSDAGGAFASNGAGTGIDMDDLVSLGGRSETSSSSRSVSNDSRGGGASSSRAGTTNQTTAVPPTTTGSAEREAPQIPFPTTALGLGSLAGVQGSTAPTSSAADVSVDPLVAAITRSLAKLVAEGSATLVDEPESEEELPPASGGAGTATGQGQRPATGAATAEEGEEETDGDGAETPLSSGASRTGSMRRRYFS
ncbi:hypothetical protein JCM10908_005355 [Rhodotorula pacifica]|uniref:uncharacterized protein n=1 Tax=Rhodotorula pacifica TaxID=1495444 RepID=UPI0031737677